MLSFRDDKIFYKFAALVRPTPDGIIIDEFLGIRLGIKEK